MGSLKAELRRFEKRRLRPILQRLKRRETESDRATTSGPMEQLLVALVRSEIRRAEPKPNVLAHLSATLQSRWTRNHAAGSGELEDLVRTMLAATPSPPALCETRREAA